MKSINYDVHARKRLVFELILCILLSLSIAGCSKSLKDDGYILHSQGSEEQNLTKKFNEIVNVNIVGGSFLVPKNYLVPESVAMPTVWNLKNSFGIEFFMPDYRGYTQGELPRNQADQPLASSATIWRLESDWAPIEDRLRRLKATRMLKRAVDLDRFDLEAYRYEAGNEKTVQRTYYVWNGGDGQPRYMIRCLSKLCYLEFANEAINYRYSIDFSIQYLGHWKEIRDVVTEMFKEWEVKPVSIT